MRPPTLTTTDGPQTQAISLNTERETRSWT